MFSRGLSGFQCLLEGKGEEKGLSIERKGNYNNS